MNMDKGTQGRMMTLHELLRRLRATVMAMPERIEDILTEAEDIVAELEPRDDEKEEFLKEPLYDCPGCTRA